MKLPVLIVGYLRPEKLEILLQSMEKNQRRVFLFIDRALPPYTELNRSVFSVAERYLERIEIETHWAKENLGVGLGVPAALDWVFQFVGDVIVLEDDCFPTESALHFFDSQVDRLQNEIVMACGTSPWVIEENDAPKESLTLSKYPLIWGWSTNKGNWLKVSKLIRSEVPHTRTLKALLKNPSKLLPISFFYAATIRVRKGKLKAWDSPLALEMLLSDYKSIIPNLTLVENSGQDNFASHFSNPHSLLEEVVSKSASGSASKEIDLSDHARKITDKEIEKKIYNMKLRNLLSPVKAFLGL